MKKLRLTQWGSIDPASLGHQLSASDRLFVGASMLGVLLWSFAPHAAAAQADAGYRPLAFEVNDFTGVTNLPTPDFTQEYFTNTFAGNTQEGAHDPRIEQLQEYLKSKNSPLADHAETLLSLDNYQLIIGISFAESNFCKRNIRPHNCWGIGGVYPESYADYEEALVRANNLIQKYRDSGLTTPNLMRNRWVGWKNHNWILAVEQVTSALEQHGL